MKKNLFVMLSLIGIANLGAESTCHKCEVIREENAKRTDYYEYYDDYLKDNPSAPTPKKVQQTTVTPIPSQKPAAK